MSEVQINNATIDIGDSLLARIQQDPDNTVQLLVNDERIGKSRVHMCLVLIEQGWYPDHAEAFINLPWSIEHKARIKEHAIHIRAMFNAHYAQNEAALHMKHLIESLLPDHAAIANLLLLRNNPDED